MKIAILSRYQNRIQRGAENFVSEISKRLSERHEVNILSDRDADNVFQIINSKYDVIIPINGRFQSLKSSIGRIFGKYKLLITGHSGQGWDDILNIAIAKPDIFVALTDYLAKWASGWAWGSKVIKIPNGIDLEKFNPSGSKIRIDLPKPIILSVGALVWYKHHDMVIRVVSKIGTGSVLIVGEGPDKEKLEKLGSKLLENRFKIKNFNYQDMPKVYRSCDLFTLPSWSREAFGIVYLEAMASGLGVVAPDDSPRREIVGSAGLFVDVNILTKYAQAIEQALKIDWSRKARDQAEKFSWGKVANLYEKIMLGMINNKTSYVRQIVK